jgi:hypothetical protein
MSACSVCPSAGRQSYDASSWSLLPTLSRSGRILPVNNETLFDELANKIASRPQIGSCGGI